MNEILNVSGLRKSYGDKLVLDDIDLTVRPHDVLCLIGASGCGKSTLLRSINMLEQPDDGTIMFEGEELTDPRADLRRLRARMGVVFQAYNLFPHMSVLDNITLAPRLVHNQSKREATETARDLLHRFGLGEKAEMYPDRLSGGQQQRAAVVRALATKPSLLLLDEVTSALDPELVGEVLDILRQLADDGTTMVLVTHEMSFAREIATEVCFLDAGQIAEQGRPEQVLVAPEQDRTRAFLKRVIG